jgi:hypothetical protein
MSRRVFRCARSRVRSRATGFSCPAKNTKEIKAMPFQKGQSGNPAGRPRGIVNRSTVLAQNLAIGICREHRGQDHRIGGAGRYGGPSRVHGPARTGDQAPAGCRGAAAYREAGRQRRSGREHCKTTHDRTPHCFPLIRTMDCATKACELAVQRAGGSAALNQRPEDALVSAAISSPAPTRAAAGCGG